MYKKLAIIFGGKSAEHEISIESAKGIYEAIDHSRYNVTLIGIDKEGFWHRCEDDFQFRQGVSFFEGCKEYLSDVDVVFPILHGPFGEDGTVQGLLEVAGIPYVGATVAGSAIGLDKDISKRLLRDANILVADFLVFKERPSFKFVKESLGLPCFIKACNMGSSISISRITNEEEFYKAIDLAFLFDSKIIVEKEIQGRELECSVLGLNPPIASLAGEVIPKNGIYTYESKYVDEEGAKFETPAKLSNEKMKELQDLAIKTFDVLCCSGMARVDFLMDKSENLYLNEINTHPGFTKISLYPKLWEISGISKSELIDQLIELAFLQHEMKKNKSNQHLSSLVVI